MNMRYEKIKQIIDEWDPIDLLSHAPKDEYDEETKEVSKLISATNEAITVELIGKIIYTVFSKHFGSNTFTCNLDECMCVAEKIIIS